LTSLAKWLGLAVVLGLVVGGASQARAGLVISVTPSLAPNAYGSPSYANYVNNAVTALETGASSYGTPNTPSYYQAIANGSTIDANQVVVTGFSSWLGQADPGTAFGAAFANELGNRLLFGLSIVETSSTDKFALADLSFTATSSDPGNSLGFSFAQGSYNYSNDYVGVIYGAGGVSDVAHYTFITSGPNTQLVNAVFGRGSGNAYDAYSSDPGATNQDKLDNVIASIPSETFSGTYTIDGISGSGNVDIASIPGPNAVPEPSSLVSAGIGIATVLGVYRRKRRKAQAEAA
jgi:hypothetical protein